MSKPSQNRNQDGVKISIEPSTFFVYSQEYFYVIKQQENCNSSVDWRSLEL